MNATVCGRPTGLESVCAGPGRGRRGRGDRLGHLCRLHRRACASACGRRPHRPAASPASKGAAKAEHQDEKPWQSLHGRLVEVVLETRAWAARGAVSPAKSTCARMAAAVRCPWSSRQGSGRPVPSSIGAGEDPGLPSRAGQAPQEAEQPRCGQGLQQWPRPRLPAASQPLAMDSAPPFRHAALAITCRRWLHCVGGGNWWSNCTSRPFRRSASVTGIRVSKMYCLFCPSLSSCGARRSGIG